MPDIFDEVKEDLRAEQARRIWLRYGGILTGVALLAVAGIGGWQGWRWYEQQQAGKAALTYLEVSRATEAAGADLKAEGERFAAIAQDAPEGYRMLSRLRAAALKAETGERDAALAIWDQVAGDSSVPKLYRDLASLMWALHGLDSHDPAALDSRLAPLVGGAWGASARELQALVAVRRGQPAEAKKNLEALANDVTAPQGVRERAGRVAAELGG
ncbi:tetratricopeptide repeat protein [Roseomonas marmotae]|uniref:Tetratricopeptide repeat protein n=1 Tax=Roseomonas marmotae TaxID=2768161 RepID=A0ABS3KE02_9PROT|nr:tetratricopeptide repeat protein [Roseomonas marmotae]MBO1075704.1 tetratricopeptide repeat protein [Roseomonas marmotae]QTI80435.1 tetratricopeptide repeat protein [Roseomonas marmotae]